MVKIENQILLFLKQHPGTVLLRREIAALASASQVSRGLRALQNAGLIERIGWGVYAKTAKDSATGDTRLVASAEDIAVEAHQKLGIAAHVVQSDSPSSAGSNVLTLDIGLCRTNRRMLIAGRTVVYIHNRVNKPLKLPTKGVSQFVAHLAREHHVTFVYTKGDAFAQNATRLAGDKVDSDNTGDLLVALRRAHKLSNREMSTLLVSHQRELRQKTSHV